MVIGAAGTYWLVAADREPAETVGFDQVCLTEVAIGFPWIAWVEITFILRNEASWNWVVENPSWEVETFRSFAIIIASQPIAEMLLAT